MKRTQIQLPEHLYDEIKRIADMLDWSITEVLRRGAEYMVGCYPPEKAPGGGWSLPPPRRLGPFVAPADRWRELANEPDGQERQK